MMIIRNRDHLAHHGIKGQKWGVRRFRNEDGSLTEAGKKRLVRDSSKFNRAYSVSEKKHLKTLKRAENLARYSKRARWLIDDEVIANKAKRLERAKRKYNKSLKKAEKIFGEMSKKYSDINIINLSPDTAKKGAEVIIRLREHNIFQVFAKGNR